MRKLAASIAVLALVGCKQELTSKDLTALEMRREQISEMQRDYLALTQTGQGCPGEILQQQILRSAVNGRTVKDIQSKNMPGISKIFLNDGSMYYTNWSASVPGRYWIAGDKICYKTFGEMIGVSWCLRLIRSPNGGLMEEILNDLNPRQISLACRHVTVTKIGEQP